MNLETAYKLILGGENGDFEIKSAQVRPDSLDREIFAFATFGAGLPMVCSEAQLMGKEIVFEEIGEEYKIVLYL